MTDRQGLDWFTVWLDTFSHSCPFCKIFSDLFCFFLPLCGEKIKIFILDANHLSTVQIWIWWWRLLQFGRSDAHKNAEDYDEIVIKGTDSKLESSLLNSDLEFYMPAMSPTPRTRPFADETSQSHVAAKNPRRADPRNEVVRLMHVALFTAYANVIRRLHIKYITKDSLFIVFASYTTTVVIITTTATPPPLLLLLPVA